MHKYINKIRTVVILLIITFFFSSAVFSQNTSLDSMKKVLQSQPDDTTKTNTLLFLSASLYQTGKTDEALPFLKQLVDLSEELKFNNGLKLGYFLMTLIYNSKSDHLAVLNNAYKGIKVFKETEDSLLLSETLQYLGATYAAIDDRAESLKNYNACLEIRQKLNNKSGISQTYNSIGEIFCKEGRYDQAMEKHIAAMAIIQDPAFVGQGWEQAYSFQCIGNVYEKQGDAAKTNGDTKTATQLFKNALEKYESSYKIWQELENDNPLSSALTELDYAIGNVNLKLGNLDIAEEKIKRSFKVLVQNGNKESLHDMYLSLSALDSAKGNFKSAQENYKLYVINKKIREDEFLTLRAEGLNIRNRYTKKEQD